MLLVIISSALTISFALGVLVAAALLSSDHHQLVPLGFAFALLALSVEVFLLALARKFGYALVLAIAFALLLAASFMEWYGEHVGEPIEPAPHRHTIWELGHVH